MTEQTNIIHEGGDSYRPIVIIGINNLDLWPNANIGYFKSSGRTNQTPIYANTWIPFGGMVEENNTIIQSETYEKGYIIKMSTLLSSTTYFRWKSTLLMNYFRTKENFHPFLDVYYETPREPMKNATTTEIQHFQEADNIRELFDKYFLFDWQLRISAQIGGGYWERNRDFHEYVLAHIELPVSVNVPVVPDYLYVSTEQELAQHVKGDEPTEGQSYSNNKNYIIAFLQEHNSQIYYNNPDTAAFFIQFRNNKPQTPEDRYNQFIYDKTIVLGVARITQILNLEKTMSQNKIFKNSFKPRKSNREDNDASPPTYQLPEDILNPPTKEKRKFSEVNENKDVGGTMKRQGKGKRKTIKRKGKGTKKRRKGTKKRNKRMK